MEMALTFNDFTFSPISYQNKIWIRATELARVLGYSRDNLVTRLYHSNEDEFTPEMTQVIEIPDSTESVPPTKARIFSLRGCHLLAMFARTPVAKAFRKWVLDVLDRIAKEETRQPDLPEIYAILQSIIDAKVIEASGSGKLKRVLYAQIWNSFRGHFKLGKKEQLPLEKLNEAITYLVQLELGKKPKAICANQEKTDRIDSSRFDRMRKQIIEELDSIDKKLGEIASLVKWQLSPTSRDTGFTQEKMNFFYMMLHLNNMAMGGIYTARQALAIAGKMKE